MIRHARVKVSRFQYVPNTGPSAHMWPLVATAVLECGHRQGIGAVEAEGRHYAPKRMACSECPGARRVM